MEKISINSPFRYAGGKFYARKLILEHVPDHNSYCEPLAGGASIFFAKPKVKQNHLNDLDIELMRVYKVIRDEPKALINFLKDIPALKEMHNYYKNEFKPKNELEKAGRYYFLNRISYSGIMKSQNCYWGYGDKYSMKPENWPSNIMRTSKKLQKVKLTNLDFEEVIDSLKDGTLIFVDPPYFNADQDKFYNCIFTQDDHFRLERVLRRNKDRLLIFLTYDDCYEIRRLYTWVVGMYDKSWNYCINRTDDQKNKIKRKGKRYKGNELFLLNYKSNGYLI